MQPKSRSPLDHWNLTPAQRESLTVMLEESAELRQELKTRDLDIAKLRAELEGQIERNRYLEEALRSTQSDLAQVERQFISLEQRLATEETKASAVATLAEVKLAYDNIIKEDSVGLDPNLAAEIERKLVESDKHLKKKNYAAAVYYAKRAHRLLERSGNRDLYQTPFGSTRIVSVSKANLRDGPGFDHQVVGSLGFGTILVQMDQAGEWSRIRTRDGQVGWVHKALIR